ENPAGVGGNSRQKAKIGGVRSVIEFDTRLPDVRPSGAARGVNQSVIHDHTGAGTDRSADIRLDADPHRLAVATADNGVLETAVAVDVSFDADQAVAELIIVAGLSAAGEKAARWRCR